MEVPVYACVTSVSVKSPPLIVDEFGILPCRRKSATAFFSLVPARYERGNIILTSNKGFADWEELLGGTVIETAILDRLPHHSHVINIRGESYRLKDKRQSGLLTPTIVRCVRGDVYCLVPVNDQMSAPIQPITVHPNRIFSAMMAHLE